MVTLTTVDDVASTIISVTILFTLKIKVLMLIIAVIKSRIYLYVPYSEQVISLLLLAYIPINTVKFPC